MKYHELYDSIVQKLNLTTIHPLHKALLEECCENAVANEQGVTDPEQLRYAVYLAFSAALPALKGVLRGSIEAAQADQATLQYRGQKFVIPADSDFLKDSL
ncbi:hypothetical protein EJV47_23770 [Hymenobacter gummosus]|uniref:Uncharacterized protein n=1 Tax=Hymenobacter gummosus TaxID=1776032 RepID=A0A431TWF2_9BACT|nr:hypothetical protein [Hymenobacter gummosus]RTQ45851.1 hypothetical protein EJV47_23770 [Hymenobacter gummosus]